MRKIWILSVFVVFMGVNSFDFRCNLPDERLRWESPHLCGVGHRITAKEGR